jgi:hypothetical protein
VKSVPLQKGICMRVEVSGEVFKLNKVFSSKLAPITVEGVVRTLALFGVKVCCNLHSGFLGYEKYFNSFLYHVCVYVYQ